MNSYIGHHLQIDGVQKYQLVEGKGRGMQFYHVRNGLGLDFDISLDRAGDITHLHYKGDNLAFLGPAGDVSSSYYDAKGSGWLKSFTAGFLTTCGLNNIGIASLHHEQEHGMHGSISHTPVENAYAINHEDRIEIFITLYDQEIFKHRLRMERCYHISKEKNHIKIIDRVINDGVTAEPLMILYHFNLGYPLLSEKTTLSINSTQQIPRDQRAAEDLESWNQMLKPTAHFKEQTYYHKIEEKHAKINVYNPTIEKGLTISFSTQQLNQLIQWKMMGINDYALGIEPANHTLHGRGNLDNEGKLKTIAPQSQEIFEVDIHFYDKPNTL